MKQSLTVAQFSRRRTFAFVVALTLTVAPLYSAQAGAGTTELGLDLGMTDLADNVSNDSGSRFGLRGSYRFTPRFELEGQASRTEANDRGQQARLNTMFVNGLFNFRPDTRIEPYLLTGVGRAKLEFRAPSFGLRADDTGNAYQYGAGSRFFVDQDRRVSVRVELTRLHERTFHDGSDYNSVSTGVAWKLGRKS